jgi:hypothetical protein
MKNFIFQDVEFNWAAGYDTDMSVPWVEHDGHGVLEQKRTLRHCVIKKSPSQVHIGNGWLYDVTASIEQARSGGWGLGDNALAELELLLGRKATGREITAEAVRADMEFCKRYLAGRVCWYRIEVFASDKISEAETLGGILCEDGDIQELFSIACQLADQLLHSRAKSNKVLDLHYNSL